MNSLNISAALPEILLLIGASMVLLIDAATARTRQVAIDRWALLALVVPFIALLWQFDREPGYAFGGMYVIDGLSSVLKLAAFIAVAVSIVYARGYATDRGLYRGEFYGLTLLSLLGQLVMISAGNLLVIYVGMELMSLALYAMTAMRRDHSESAEAAMKYFVLGCLASGFLLYGMSMIYGAAGSLDLNEIARSIVSENLNGTIFVFGLAFIVAGIAFKFGAVPFHMWAPDVYQGSPTAATLLIAGAPKLATFAITFRLLVEGLLPVVVYWQQMLLVLSVLSLVLGNLVAIAQTNFKRMLAYSAIAQVGFMLLGLLSGVSKGNFAGAPDAYSASMFYIITYVLTTLGTFGLLQLLSSRGVECERIADLAGLSRRSPWMALVMLVLMFSLAGIPPTVGFYAKLTVLQATVAAGQVWLAVLAVLASLVGAFYYLRVVKVMYFDEPTDTTRIHASGDAKLVLAANGLAVLLLGILPGPLMALCLDAIRQSLGS